MVKMHRVSQLAATQDVFTFVHPNPDAVIDNTRYARLLFDRTGEPAALCHGFAGFFDSQVSRPLSKTTLCVADKVYRGSAPVQRSSYNMRSLSC